MLEELDRVDMIAERDGKTLLIITDAGITPDAAERRKLLQAKLQAYSRAVAGKRIPHENLDPASMLIVVSTASSPDGAYDGIASISIALPGGEPVEVPVLIEHVPSPYGGLRG